MFSGHLCFIQSNRPSYIERITPISSIQNAKPVVFYRKITSQKGIRNVAKHRYLPLVGFTVVFVLLMVGILCRIRQVPDITEQVRVVVDTDTGTETVRLWTGEDGTLYCFLPSYAEPPKTRWQTDSAFLLNGIEYGDGADFRGIPSDTACTLRFSGRDYPLCILHGSDIPAMHITTRTDSLDKIHEDKQNTEKVSVSIYRADGTADFRDTRFGGKLSGHGNWTWTYDKKPYNLNFSAERDLLGMGAGKKWVLIANYMDPTNLRNSILYRLAAETSTQWNPDLALVDLYINENYMGLYQLTEKIEATDSKVQVGSGTLMDLELDYRIGDYSIRNLFEGISAEIRYPKDLKPGQIQALSDSLSDLRDTVASGKASQEYLTEHLDIPSWAWKYLLEEISMNFDTGACSQYAVYENGRLTSSAAWDYDNIWGLSVHTNPRCFLAQREWKDCWTATPWYHWLWQYPLFSDTVKQMYRDDFLPRMEQLLDGGLDSALREIRASSAMDETRWPGAYERYSFDEGTVQLRSFLTERLRFLTDAWLGGKTYYTVCLKIESYLLDGESESECLHYAVEAGTPFSELPDAKALQIPGFLAWIDEATGEEFDPSQPITHNITLCVSRQEDAAAVKAPGFAQRIVSALMGNYRILILLILGTAMAVFGLVMVRIDIHRRRRQHERTEVSA